MDLQRKRRAVGVELACDEGGFTIVEVLIAGVVLVLGSMAIFMTFGAAIHNVQRSRETQIGISVAQREMERVRVIPYASIGSTSPAPTFLAGATPRSRLKLNGTTTEFDLKRSTTAEEFRPLMTGGLVAPESTGVTSSDGTQVTVYRYVVCEEVGKTAANCLAKRIVIDVLPTTKGNLGNYQRSYYELQSTLVDPTPLN